MLAYLAEDRWLTLARHANAMADKLAAKLTAAGLKPVWPVEANLIFVVLPRALDAKLKAAGATYYVRSSESLDVGTDNVLVRLGHVVRHGRLRYRTLRRPLQKILIAPKRRPNCS